MSDRSERSRFFDRLTWACAVANALPLFFTRHLPLTDYPEHAAAIATLRHWLDPAWDLQSTYVLALGKTEYLAYHLVGALLALVVPNAELASRLLVAVVAVAFPLSARSMLRAFHADERLAVFVCAAFWSRPLRIGFLPYVASVPCVLFLIAAVLAQIDLPTRRRAVALAFAAVGVFYVHVSGYILLVAIACALAVLAEPFSSAGIVRAGRRSLWLVPSMLVAIAWKIRGDGPIAASGPNEIWYMPARDRIGDFPLWAHDIWATHADDACAIVLWLAIAFLALLRRSKMETSWRAEAARWAPFACTLVLYFALPTQVGAAASVNERLALFFPLFLLPVIRPRDSVAARGAIALGAAASMGLALVAAVVMRTASNEELGDVDAVLAKIPPRAKLVTLVFHSSSAYTSISPWLQMGSYHRVASGGVASYSFSEIAHWPIHYAPGAEPPPHGPFWEFNPCVYRNATDGAYYDYVLTRGAIDPFRDAPPGPKWRVVGTAKDWTLYEKIAGAVNPAWPVEDRGPCESRWSAERAALGR